MRKLSFLFFSLLFIASCANKSNRRDDILPEGKMRDVLWDMISAGQYLNLYVLTKDSVDKVAASAKVYGQVFQVNHITKEEFTKSYAYYREHPELLKPILDSLSKKQAYTVEKLQRKGDSLQKKVPFFREK